jgi:molybdopterin converting factor small subunit|nr:MAG: molybdopterin converting factor small subunit [Bacteroidota bacterium]
MLRIRLFGPLQDVVGADRVELPHAGPITVSELWTLLEARYPDLSAWRTICRVAVDGRYVRAEAEITDPEEIALLPPVSGG